MLDTWPKLLNELEGMKNSVKIHDDQIAKLNGLNTFCKDSRIMIIDLQNRMTKLEN